MWKLTKIIVSLILISGIIVVAISLLFGDRLFEDSVFSLSKDLSKMKDFVPQEGNENLFKEFVSPDEELKLKYSTAWMDVNEEILATTIPNKAKEDYNFERLLFASKFSKETVSNLIVSQAFFDEDKEIEEIIEIIKELNEEDGLEMRIIEEEMKDNRYSFEATYKKDNSVMNTKEEMILMEPKEGKRKIFFVSFVVYNESWENYKEEAEDIFHSIQIIK